MYYYYHQYLQGVLAAERWVCAEDLRRQPYSLLSVPSHKEANELFTRVKKTLGKGIGSHVTIMKEATVSKPDAWPIRTQGSPTQPVFAESDHPKLISFILMTEAENFQLVDSSKIIDPSQMETLDDFDNFNLLGLSGGYFMSSTQHFQKIRSFGSGESQERREEFGNGQSEQSQRDENQIFQMELNGENTGHEMILSSEQEREESSEYVKIYPDNSGKTEQLQGQEGDLEDDNPASLSGPQSLDALQPMLNFAELHRNFSSKKQYSAVKEGGKIILENSTLTFDGYQLAQDIDAAAQLLDKIFHHIEDISKHYGDALRDIEAQISDELHFVEFADVDACRCVKSYKRLQDLRVKRRCLKDSMLMANLLVRTMGKELPKKLSNVSEKINHLDERTYEVRVPNEFQH